MIIISTGVTIRGMMSLGLLLLLAFLSTSIHPSLETIPTTIPVGTDVENAKNFQVQSEAVVADADVQKAPNGDKHESELRSQAQPDVTADQEQTVSSSGFVHAFVASISVIIVSEIGDKTFFIAAIMAMKYSRLTVFGGAISALGLMTFLSVCLGFATMVIPRWVTLYICTLLLAVFGLKMLHDGWKMAPDEGQEELEEVTAELKKKDELMSQSMPPSDPEQGLYSTPSSHRRWRILCCLTPVFVQAFTLTFLAEWGDRSQVTTIVLSARENPVGVTLGGTLGHALCTALAVMGGKMIAQKISVRTVTLIGGVVFLVFAFSAFLHDVTPQTTNN